MVSKKPAALRPKVVCLMETSVDGKIIGDRWPDPDAADREYERVHELHRADAWLCGRVVMAYFARTQRRTTAAAAISPPVREKADFIAPGKARSYAVAVDAGGKLRWRANNVNGDRLIVLLSRRASLHHLTHLQSKRISYLIVGQHGIDFAAALAKLRKHFGIKLLMLEGGGRINASLFHAGLIDELSLLLAPVADGDSATTSLFETDSNGRSLRARGLRLLKVVRRPHGVLWLRYRVLNGEQKGP